MFAPSRSNASKKNKRNKQKKQKNEEDEAEEGVEANEAISNWFEPLCSEENYMDITYSNKLLLLMSILKESEQIGDKVLVFTQSIPSLNTIQHFVETQTQPGWKLGKQFFRIEGDTPMKERDKYRRSFNKESNHTARWVFLRILCKMCYYKQNLFQDFSWYQQKQEGLASLWRVQIELCYSIHHGIHRMMWGYNFVFSFSSK